MFEYLTQHDPNKVALQDASGSVQYGELMGKVDARVDALHGVDVLAIALDNSVEWVLWDLAALKAEIPCVPLPPFFTDDQIHYVLSTAGVTHILSEDGIRPTGILSNREGLPEGTAKVTFTSGTTGTPKGVCLPKEAMQDVAESIVSVLGQEFVGIHFCTLPLAVLLENIAGVYAALIAGCTVKLTGLKELGAAYTNFHSSLKEAKATSAILVPEILRILMKQVAEKGCLPDLKFLAVGGSKVDVSLVLRAREMGLPVYEGYGLSECASVVSLNTPEHDRPGTVGKLLPHIKARISDGEVQIKNPAFLGYIGERAPCVFSTGDLGELYADDVLCINGRKKNVLITSYGRNVSPEWVEATLLSRPEIAQVVVYGDAQPHLSALIVPSDRAADLESAVAEVNHRLPEYARIQAYKAVSPFTLAAGTLTGTGRPRREQILTLYTKEKTMTFYERLVKETESARAELYHVPQLMDGLQGNISRETYIAYLTEAFHHVSHTVRFLMACGQQLPESKKFLHKAIAEYIEEEVGHEEWILNDVEAAGGDKEIARNATPNLETQLLIAYNYDYIQRKNPVGFFGMVFMLESTSTQIANKGADAVKSSLKLPKKAFSYLYSHGELDISHMKFFEETVNKITDKDDQEAIIEVAKNTFHLFANVLRSIPHDAELKNAA